MKKKIEELGKENENIKIKCNWQKAQILAIPFIGKYSYDSLLSL